MIDSNKQNELRNKYNPDGSTLRKAQLRMVDMLCFIDKVCQENGLRYWISFGTLLGAIRHGGFIPWDDDTDICMPIEDMLRFKQIMLQNNPSKEFVLQCHESDPEYYRTQWIVLRDLKSECKQDSLFHLGLRYKGLQVDIFPVEKGVSLGLKKCVDFLEKTFVLCPILSNKWYYKILSPFRGLFWNVINNFVIPACRRKRFKRHKDTYIISYGVKIPFDNIGETNTIFPLVRVCFEGHEFNAPKNFDEYLVNLYGKWEKIPSSTNIRTHNIDVVFK